MRVAYGVPALPHGVREQVEQRFGLDCISGFGMSETTYRPARTERHAPQARLDGRPRHHPDPSVPRTEARIVDHHGDEVGPGVVGELVLRNAAMMLGYFKDPERTAEALRDGWLPTGDSAWRDEDGWFYFVDRVKDIIRRRGENVSSLEVEHDAQRAPVGSGIRGHRRALRPARRGHLRDRRCPTRPSARSRRAHHMVCRAAGAFKVPRYIEFVTELPKTSTAKIEKHRLAQRRIRTRGPHRHRRGGYSSFITRACEQRADSKPGGQMTTNTSDLTAGPLDGVAPNVETVRALISQHKNWGRWGADDQVGTLNHVDPDDVVRAASTIRSGKRILARVAVRRRRPADAADSADSTPSI